MVGQIEVHLRRGLGARRKLEHEPKPVDSVFLPGVGDLDRRVDQGDRSGRIRLSENDTHLSSRVTVDHGAVHVADASCHRPTGVDPLGNEVFDEFLGCDHRAPAGVDVLLGGDASDAAVMVGVAMGVDDGGDGTLSAVFAVGGQGGRCGLGGDQRVDSDHAFVALDQREVGGVESAHLIYQIRDDLIEALHRGQRRLAPEAWIDRIRRLTGHEGIRVVVPHHAAVVVADDT